jgi:hypothetical protein
MVRTAADTMPLVLEFTGRLTTAPEGPVRPYSPALSVVSLNARDG